MGARLTGQRCAAAAVGQSICHRVQRQARSGPSRQQSVVFYPSHLVVVDTLVSYETKKNKKIVRASALNSCGLVGLKEFKS